MKPSITRICLSTFAVAIAAAAPASHAAQRTFVSTSGNNANPCSLVAPCREFSIALAHTDPDGEVVVLDSGGYGSVIIGQSVSIIAPPGVYAGISVFSGTGIDITAPGARVTLRGITINGQGGTIGISFASGESLKLERCAISGMATIGVQSLAANSTFAMSDSLVTDSGSRGVYLVAGAMAATLERVRVERTTGHPANGIEASGGVGISVIGSTIVNNNGNGIRDADGFTAGGSLTLSQSVVADNGLAGVSVVAAQGHTQRVSISDTVVARNGHEGIATNATNAGSLAITDVARATVAHNAADGLAFSSGAGAAARGAVTSTTISDNDGDGVFATGAGTLIVVGSSTLLRNFNHAFAQASSASFRTRGDNTAEANANGATTGVISPASGPI